MTTYSKVKQTLVSLQGAKATMESYAQLAQDEGTRKSFRRNAERLDEVLARLKRRIQSMEFEEPQYKGF
ncbi:DUF1657 domain-containing protein [Desmospora activa]|uniref:Uncharacterized protein DUF1657 n=1 Tax=Desmospora activa DSM 45169 TaxID=1121389 RepID=A0A2T4Z7B1_9BACL|nr:DUF1657 domain-containing protein [Desmospora activa]PTM57763.1 uncharacterized protein DUF1657 [Desmospora activa DSM 45169]